MEEEMEQNKFWAFCAVIASFLCFVAGLWILTAGGFDHGSDATGTAIGIYFIGKAFFVGPLLYITAVKKKNG